MISHPYNMDAQNRAQDLASTILAASTPPQIVAACSSVEAFLHKHPSDQSRSFFSIAFPVLICKLFGFDGSSPSPSRSSPSNGWLDRLDPEVACRVFDLLSPYGILFSSISSVDRHSLIKYVFPVERFPEWMRYVLRSQRYYPVLSDLCPLFKSRVKEDPSQKSVQIQLNVFEYYIFWFAYYPVCKGNSENSNALVIRKNRRFRLENWTSSWSVLSRGSRQSGQKMEDSLYLQLLYAYLRVFVPKSGLGSYQPYRSSLLHYSFSYDGSIILQAEFLVYTLIHFWMVDNDFSPLPVSVCRSLGLSFPYRAVLGETPPTVGLGEVLKLLVKYLNCGLIASTEGTDQVGYGGSSGWYGSGSCDAVKSRNVILSCEHLTGSWNSLVQRPLYRFILRSFLFCPIGTSIKNASQVFSLWTTYMEPWKTSSEDFIEFDAPGVHNRENLRKEKSGEKEGCHSEPMYSPAWQGFVLSNYLFYSSLVMHFLGFAHKFLHTNVETIIQMVLQVLNILTSLKELTDLLKKVDVAYHSKPTGSSSAAFGSLHKYISSIREQLQDWEDGLCEGDADGSFLHENWNRDLRLFADGDDGAHQLLQLLILRAESEIQAVSGDNLEQNLQTLGSLRAQMDNLFGGPVQKYLSPVTIKEDSNWHARDEIFTPKHPGVGKRTWADVKYKGDWMRRPTSDSEMAWLARLLVSLSDWLNEVLGVNRGGGSDPGGPTYIEVPPNEQPTVFGVKDGLWMVLTLVGSWLMLLSQAVVTFMRERGIRINLRVFASKKFAVALLVYVAVSSLRKAFGLCLQSPSFYLFW